MPAAAMSVHPANAVDCEFFNLDFFKDTRFFAACYFRLVFYFHGILLLFFVASSQDALMYAVFIATPMPTNRTTIYPLITARFYRMSSFAYDVVWRNGAYCDSQINPCGQSSVLIIHSEYFVYRILNLRFAISGVHPDRGTNEA